MTLGRAYASLLPVSSCWLWPSPMENTVSLLVRVPAISAWLPSALPMKSLLPNSPAAFRKAKGYREASKTLNQLAEVEVKAGLLAWGLQLPSHKSWGCHLQDASMHLQVWVLLGMGGSYPSSTTCPFPSETRGETRWQTAFIKSHRISSLWPEAHRYSSA